MNVNTSMSSMYQTQRPMAPPPTGQGLTERLDADKSGGLTATEIEDTRLSKMIGDRFGEVDVDGDGALSVSELDAELKANGPPEGGRPPPPPGGGEGGPQGAGGSAGVDIASLFESIFSSVEAEAESDDATAASVAETLYAEMQNLFTDLSVI